jgi:hypothetical protein
MYLSVRLHKIIANLMFQKVEFIDRNLINFESVIK